MTVLRPGVVVVWKKNEGRGKGIVPLHHYRRLLVAVAWRSLTRKARQKLQQ